MNDPNKIGGITSNKKNPFFSRGEVQIDNSYEIGSLISPLSSSNKIFEPIKARSGISGQYPRSLPYPFPRVYSSSGRNYNPRFHSSLFNSTFLRMLCSRVIPSWENLFQFSHVSVPLQFYQLFFLSKPCGDDSVMYMFLFGLFILFGPKKTGL